jgi:hypothetical protein
MVGPKKQDFWPGINKIKGNYKKNPLSIIVGSSKRAKIATMQCPRKGTCIVNAYCQFSQQACTNFMQTYLYLLISTHFFILTTNLHCTFKVDFQCQQLTGFFSLFFIYEYQFRRPLFCNNKNF